MSGDQSTREHAASPADGRTFDADLNFLSRCAGPLVAARPRDAGLHFHRRGRRKIASYAGVADYMQANGVDGRLLPLVILTELGGGLLVLFGLKTRWAAIALFGYCLLTALFFHLGADQTIQFNKNIAMAGGFLALAIFGPGALVAGRLARASPRRDAGKRPSVWPRLRLPPCQEPPLCLAAARSRGL